MSTRFREFVETVRSATNLVDVIGPDVALSASGSVLRGLSPFHPETNPSFVVWPHSQTWHDFSNGGGLGGDVFSYVQRRQGVSFKEALFQQAARVGVANPFTNGAARDLDLEREVERRAIEELFSKAAAYYHRALPAEIRLRYFREQYGFVDDTIDTLLLGFADGQLQAHFKSELGVERELALKTGLFVVTPGGKIKDFFQNRLVFPYWKQGRVVYFIARATERTENVEWERAKYKKLLTHSDKHAYVAPVVGNDYFYNEDGAHGTDEILLTEGVTDCISAMQAEIACISPVTTRFRTQDLDKLLELTRRAKRIMICNDAEASGAGAAGALETARALHAEGRDVRIAVLPRPDGVDKVDTNEFLKAHSADEFRQVLRSARRYVDFLIEAIPAETAKGDLEPLLEPVMRALQSASAIEKEAHIDTLVGRFKIGRRSLQAMLRETRKEERAKEANESKRKTVLSQVEDAPVTDEHVVPRGWVLNDVSDGDDICLYKTVESKESEVFHVPVSSRPVVLTAWVKNLTSGNKMLEVAWKAGGKWRQATVDRERLLDSVKIVEALTGRGFPVSSTNRADMVAYLSDYEAANVAAMPVRAMAEQMGWVGERRDLFLCGESAIAADGSTSIATYRPTDEGEGQLIEALKPGGTFEAWADAMATIASYPRAMLGIYASFAPPLLELLKLPGFGIDWSHRTTSGKTVVLRAAASVWGNPDERDGRSLVRTWKTSLVGFERLASALKNLPILLDDSKVADHPRLVADILYLAAAGHGKSRGSIRGSRRTTSWRTILLSTGERKATDFTKDGGSVVRCLAIWGPVFGEPCDEVAIRIKELERILRRNHGHAGPQFVRWLMQREVSELRRRFDELHDQIWHGLKQHFDAAIAARISDAVAVVELAGELVHEALPLPWSYSSPWGATLEPIAESVRDVDRAWEGLLHFYNWALVNRELFENMRTSQRLPETWVGRWDDGEFIAINEVTLREVLEAGGYEFDAIVRLWHERGWLDHGPGRRKEKVRVRDRADWYYKINRRALDDLDRGASGSSSTDHESQ